MTDEPAILVCSPEQYFADDIAATCDRCHTAVYHRPHSPRDITRLCTRCWTRRPDWKNDRVFISEETRQELALLALFGRVNTKH